jgi:hypothetical protein
LRIILQKSLLTKQQTTYRFGAFGNSGLGSAEERGFSSGKGRKKPFLAEIAFHRTVWEQDAAGSSPVTSTIRHGFQTVSFLIQSAR